MISYDLLLYSVGKGDGKEKRYSNYLLLSLMHSDSTGVLPHHSWGSSRKELIFHLHHVNVFITERRF